MRNFNQPVAVALASAASLLGSNALAAQAQAETPVSSPDVFNQCARSAVNDGSGSSLRARIEVQPGIVGQATFYLDNYQNGPIETGSGIYCSGLEGEEATIRLKVGSFSETIPNADAKIVFAGTSWQEHSSVEAVAAGGFSYKRACQIARQRKGTKVSVDIHEKLTYTEQGYPTAKGEDDFVLSGGLPCRRNKLGYDIEIA